MAYASQVPIKSSHQILSMYSILKTLALHRTPKMTFWISKRVTIYTHLKSFPRSPPSKSLEQWTSLCALITRGHLEASPGSPPTLKLIISLNPTSSNLNSWSYELFPRTLGIQNHNVQMNNYVQLIITHTSWKHPHCVQKETCCWENFSFFHLLCIAC